MARLAREQRVQWIDADRRRTELPRRRAKPGEVGEIAHAPAASAAQAVELRGQPPAARARLQLRRQIARGRRHRDRGRRRRAAGREIEPVIAERRLLRQTQPTLFRVPSPLGMTTRFELQMPVHRAGIVRQAERDRRGFGRDDVERVKTERRGLAQLRNCGGGLLGLGRQSECGDQRRQRPRVRFVDYPKRVGVTRLDSEQRGNRMKRRGCCRLAAHRRSRIAASGTAFLLLASARLIKSAKLRARNL